ncbi:histone-like nucleoid-structuring protein Lsr2 [Streptomyces sp. B1I3]|uniref:Lsr2 family DNA-binding protein n=1 Tax=Streptomyces sp. B1I3 TaxID=3042264 RepID=UPI0027827328|nr:histone-like nucleoid-structuring protein Lsr2 [Streptomyces sp. B1I3]MDQ0793569.1 hypothetical protein [Streptomyces sp. B1I3]
MATTAVPVTAAEKDQEGVKEVVTQVPGVGPMTIYVKVSVTDDVDGKTTEDVQTLRLSLPVQAETEVEVLDAEGEPVKNEDGSTKLTTETYFKNVWYELDMGKASREKLEKALVPFMKNARETQSPIGHTAAASTSKSAHDLTAIREWAKANNHEVADKGRIATKIVEAYYIAVGKPNPDKS